MLLSNLTQVSAGAIKLLQVDVKNHARRGTHVVQLLQLFAGYRGWDRGITESLADPYVERGEGRRRGLTDISNDGGSVSHRPVCREESYS